MEASDVEGEGSRPVGLDYLAVFDREVVQRVVQVRHLAGLVPEPDELPVVLQDEIPGSPIPYVFSCNNKKMEYRSICDCLRQLSRHMNRRTQNIHTPVNLHESTFAI